MLKNVEPIGAKHDAIADHYKLGPLRRIDDHMIPVTYAAVLADFGMCDDFRSSATCTSFEKSSTVRPCGSLASATSTLVLARMMLWQPITTLANSGLNHRRWSFGKTGHQHRF